MFEILILFVFGLVIGSFLNVLIWRLDDEKAPKFWQGRSICPKCKHELTWSDNIPLFSYLSLGGKCRYCHKKISIQYPIVELTTAIMTVRVFNFQFPILNFQSISNFSIFNFILVMTIVYSFEVIFFADWIYGLIPDEMEIVIVIATIIFNFQFLIFNQFQISNFKFSIELLGQNLVVGLISALAFFLVVLATKFKGMGLGDVKLAFVMGFLLGFPKSLVAFWFSFILGGIFAILLLLLKRRKFRETIALGPFLVLGTLVAVLFSNQLLSLIGF